jgi:hypothetical protein
MSRPAVSQVDDDGVFLRLANDYLRRPFAPPQDLGGRQNISGRNTKHLRSFWDSTPRWLHRGSAHSATEPRPDGVVPKLRSPTQHRLEHSA